jgi:hypothetical protein
MERRRFLAGGHVLCLQWACSALRKWRLETPGSAGLHRDARGTSLTEEATLRFNSSWKQYSCGLFSAFICPVCYVASTNSFAAIAAVPEPSTHGR